MGIYRHYLKNTNFLLTKFYGKVDDKSLMQHVKELNDESEGLINLRELADFRDVKSNKNLTTVGLTKCAKFEKSKKGSLLAILIPESPLNYGMARAYQMFSESYRKDVEIFTDINEALAWLSQDEQEVQILLDHINSAQVSNGVHT